VLDWLEPDNTLLPSTEPPKADAMEGVDHPTGQKFPEVMFVAKFDPPLIVPYGLAMQIYNSTNAPLDMYQTTTFDGLMFPRGPDDKVDNESRQIKREATVQVFSKDGEKTAQVHKNELWIEKIDYGRTLTELPFSHPRQLVEMLPALRQYAFLSTVLEKSFGASSRTASKPQQKTDVRSKKDEFADFMAQISVSDKSMDVAFSTQPVPRLRVVFPFKKSTVNVTFEIKLNGAVEVVAQNLVDRNASDENASDEGMGKKLTVADLGRMLEITEDLGIWAEFVKRRLG